MKINTNISAIIANKELRTTETALSRSLERLSSGLKLNHSQDDAAGMAISQKMKTQLRGLDRANKNAADGISVIETAEGALTEIHDILQRMRELAVGAASDSNTLEDRQSIQKEITSLENEIDRISKDTEFNMQSLLDGNLARRAYTNVNDTEVIYMSEGMPADIYGITVTKDATQATVTGGDIDRGTLDAGVTKDSGLTGNIKINGIDVAVEEGDTTDVILDKLQEACTLTGVTLTGTSPVYGDPNSTEPTGYEAAPLDTATSLKITTNTYGANAEVVIEGDNPQLLAALGLSTTSVQGSDVEAEFTQGDDGRVGFDDAATITTEGQTITIRSAGGFEMKVKSGEGVTTSTTDANGNTVTGTAIELDVTELGMMTVHVGANEQQELIIDIPEITTETLGIDGVNVHTYKLAGDAITRLDGAISMVSLTRSKLGAYQNRLEHSMSNLDISEENLTASLSRIMDVDMAEEMTEYTQLNVLSQAGISMLSQANARPETVLQLLQ